MPLAPPAALPPRVAAHSLATTAMFVALASTWGSSFLLIKVGLEGLSPAQVVWARVVLGAAALLIVTAATRAPLPADPRIWAHLLVVAVLLCLAPFALFAWAELHVSSSLASVLNATTPLQTVLVAVVALPQERLSARRATGLLVGFAGVLTVLAARGFSGGGTDLLGCAACLGATACYGVAFVYLRRFVAGRGLDAVPVATVQVGLAAVIALLATPLVARPAPVLTVPVVLSMVALGALGTGLAYVWNTVIVTRWGATNAATVTYLTPVVGVALGVLVLSEPLAWNEPVGAALVVLGVLITQGRLSGRLRPGGRPTPTNPRRAAEHHRHAVEVDDTP